MKVLFLAPWPVDAASTRLRVAQYFPYLRENGVEPILRPFMTDSFYRFVYRRGRTLYKSAQFAACFARRVVDIATASKVDLVFVHREAFPVGGPFIEEKLAGAGPPMVFDFDDAIYLLNTGLASRTVGLLKRPSKTARIVNLPNSFL